MPPWTNICKPTIVKYKIQSCFIRHLSKCSSPDKLKEHYDIVIVGGGIIGSTVACTLGKNERLSAKRILLLESAKFRPYNLPEKYSNRVVSLNPGTKRLLSEIGAWKHIESGRFAKVKRLQVSDALSDASITFGEEKSSEDVAYIVENDLLVNAVKKENEMIENVEVLYENKINKIHLPSTNEKSVEISLENGKEYTCDLMIGCDGANSQVRQAMGIQYLNWNYDNMGIVATVKFSEEIDNCISWQRFLPTGPVALLPLNSSTSSLVWSTTVEHTRQLLKLSDEQFVDALNEALYKIYSRHSVIDQALKTFDNFLRAANIPADVNRRYPPKIVSINAGSRASFPYGFGHATSYIGPGVALVGDAAHKIHPLAGQGVNLGFGDVSCLNRVLGEAVYSGSSLGSVSFLREYETERQTYNVSIMAVVEGMYRLYTTDFTPVVLLRSLGLQATDILNPLKKMMVSHASV